MSNVSREDSNDEEEFVSQNSLTSTVNQADEAPIDDVSAIISAETDDEGEGGRDQDKSFLRYKHKAKKNFGSPKNLNRLAEHLAKVENALKKKRSKKLPKAKPVEPAVSLSTPSELTVAPSDFEHVFHAQQSAAELQANKAQEVAREHERREQERHEQEVVFKLFQRYQPKEPTIPIYTLDENALPKIINVSLSRLNQLNKMFIEQFKPHSGKSVRLTQKTNIPFVKPFTKKEPPIIAQLKHQVSI